MPRRVRRGLGLVAVALIAWLVGLALDSNGAPTVATAVPVLVVLGCGAVGLVLVAWGLLRG